MRHLRYAAALTLALLLTGPSLATLAAQSTVPAATVTLTPAQMEEFLLRAKVVRTQSAGGGVTNSLRATLSDGTLTHAAHIQVIDQAKPIFQAPGAAPEFNFTDSYRFNIAGYRLALLLGLDNVPMSVERSYNSKRAAFTWWVDDFMMDERTRIKTGARGPDSERTAMQIHIMRVFDELIQNRDRNQGNLLWTTDWKMWMIDHTRGFRTGDQLLKPMVLERVERSLFENMRALTVESVTKAMDKSLTRYEIDALLKRRDLIVKLFEARIAERGEGAIVYTLPR